MKSEMLHKVIFRGNIQPGLDIEAVKAKIMAASGISEAGVKNLFNKPTVVLKKNISFSMAQKFKNQFEKSGALCEIEPMTTTSGTGSSELKTEITASPIQLSEGRKNIKCPKCGHPQPRSLECSNCGIIFSKYMAPGTKTSEKQNPDSVQEDGKEVTQKTIEKQSSDDGQKDNKEITQKQKIYILFAALAVIIAICISILSLSKPEPMTLKEYSAKKNTKVKASGKFILSGYVRETGTASGHVMVLKIEKNKRQYKYIRLNNENGDAAVVWVDPGKFELPKKNDVVEIKGKFERTSVKMGKIKMSTKINVGYVTHIKVIGKRVPGK